MRNFARSLTRPVMEDVMNHLFYVFYESSEDDPSNGDLIEKVCVDGKVHMTFHMTFNSSWYDQSGCEAEVYDCVYYGDLVPCDGSCLPTRDLPPEAEELVRKFTASDGRGEARTSARRVGIPTRSTTRSTTPRTLPALPADGDSSIVLAGIATQDLSMSINCSFCYPPSSSQFDLITAARV